MLHDDEEAARRHSHGELVDPAADEEEVEQAEPDETEQGRPRRSFWRELPFLIAIALVAAVVIKTFLVQAFFIPSGSMRNTLREDDRVMVNKLAYRFGDPHRGDVIVFDSPYADDDDNESIPEAVVRNVAEALGISSPASEFIKRVVGLPGETVEIRNNQVLIDGRAIAEPYVHPTAQMRDMPQQLIPPDTVWVMGDNRNNSRDSREFGPVPIDEIVGKAFIKVWPPSRWGGL